MLLIMQDFADAGEAFVRFEDQEGEIAAKGCPSDEGANFGNFHVVLTGYPWPVRCHFEHCRNSPRHLSSRAACGCR